MALVFCRECRRKISNLAATCPHCGAPGFATSAATAADAPIPPQGKQPPTPLRTKVVTVTAVALALGVAFYIDPNLKQWQRERAATQQQEQREDARAARAKAFEAAAPKLELDSSAAYAAGDFATVVSLLSPWRAELSTDMANRLRTAIDKAKSAEDDAAATKLATQFREAMHASKLAEANSIAILMQRRYGASPALTALAPDLKILGEKLETERLETLWVYSADPNPMGPGDVRTATIKSHNAFALDSPYEGQQHGVLLIRKHPKHGLDVIFAVERGQLHCSYRDCRLAVRFDDGPEKSFGADEPDNNASHLLFFQDAAGFVAAMQRAHRVRIHAQFHRQPPVVIEFHVSGYNRERL